MSFTVAHDDSHNVAVLSHEGSVDVAEIHQSRLELKDAALRQRVRGVIIDITGSVIEASPVEIIENVEGLAGDLMPNMRLAFVSADEAAQSTVSMIVATVAHTCGTRVGQFNDLAKAKCWLARERAEAVACGCMPLTDQD
ncbi:hypothetical protein [Maricaulis sp.]|uniref:hypothetical protein n=1 Tax=Maricaulis sp. TaxID=1486257 RepID=UPI00260A1CF7|nr:hypothetical protein [Maricaulis sp.]